MLNHKFYFDGSEEGDGGKMKSRKKVKKEKNISS